MKKGFEKLVLAQWHLRPPRTLFILGHIRSGSSLLVHILDSHPELRALGESWLEYHSKETLKELVLFVHAAQRNPFVTETYIVDKILHDELLEGEGEREVLRVPTLSAIFLVREPERSLLSMVAHRERLKMISDWHSALEHYSTRLSRLVCQARTLDDRRRALFVRYEQLIDDPARTLRAMQEFLRLRTPLSNVYRVNRFTGVAGLGDFSEHIKAGRIVRTEAASELCVPADVLAQGKAAHARCVAALTELSTSVAGA